MGQIVNKWIQLIRYGEWGKWVR